MNKQLDEREKPTGVNAAPADARDTESRIERARKQLPVSAPERQPSDSRWQNWYSR